MAYRIRKFIFRHIIRHRLRARASLLLFKHNWINQEVTCCRRRKVEWACLSCLWTLFRGLKSRQLDLMDPELEARPSTLAPPISQQLPLVGPSNPRLINLEPLSRSHGLEILLSSNDLTKWWSIRSHLGALGLIGVLIGKTPKREETSWKSSPSTTRS